MFGLEISSHFKALTALLRKIFFLFRKKNQQLKFLWTVLQSAEWSKEWCSLHSCTLWPLHTILTLNISVGRWCYSILPAKVATWEGILVLPEASKKWLTDICVISLNLCEMPLQLMLLWSLSCNGQLPLFPIKRSVTQQLLTCLLCLHNDVMRLVHVTSTLTCKKAYGR